MDRYLNKYVMLINKGQHTKPALLQCDRLLVREHSCFSSIRHLGTLLPPRNNNNKA